jgi:hypothetical protein
VRKTEREKGVEERKRKRERKKGIEKKGERERQ